MARHEHAHVVLGLAVAALAVDEDLLDVAAVEVADRPLDQAAFLVDQRGRDGLQRQVADHLPLAQQVFVVALDLGLGAVGARRPDDQAGALGHDDRAGDLLELLAVDRVGDLAGDAAAARGIGHQHAVAAGEGEVGRQRRTLVAALFLDDLHQKDLADLDDFLDLVAPLARLALDRAFVGEIVAADGLVFGVRSGGRVGGFLGDVDLDLAAGGGGRRRVLEFGADDLERFHDRLEVRQNLGGDHRVLGRRGALGGRLAAAAASRASPGLGFLGRSVFVRLSGVFGLLGQQRLAVGLGDLVIIGMDFRECQKPVAIAAIFDEGGLERRLDPGHFRKVDVAGELPLV